jgi:hypothetical protein
MFAMIGGLAALCIVLYLLVAPVVGVIAIAFSVYITIQFMRSLYNQLSHLVRTTEDAITFQLSRNEITTIPWREVTHAGEYYEPKRSKPVLFVYRETDDTFMTIPPEFSNFTRLHETIKQYTEGKYYTVHLEQGQTIESYLRDLINETGNQ